MNKWTVAFTSKLRRLIMDQVWSRYRYRQRYRLVADLIGYGQRTITIDLRQLSFDDVVELDKALERIIIDLMPQGDRTRPMRRSLINQMEITGKLITMSAVDRLALVVHE